MSSGLMHKPFYFLRHGQTDWNLERKWQGSKDIPLNETGIAQAESVRPLVEALDIKTICVSPLQRARKTADVAAGQMDIAHTIVEDLHEVSFGPYEGSNHMDSSWYQDWREGLRVEGVEDYDTFIARSLGGINQALALEGPVLIVAHGGVFWSVREHARLDPELGAWNCGLFHLTPPEGELDSWNIDFLNQRP